MDSRENSRRYHNEKRRSRKNKIPKFNITFGMQIAKLIKCFPTFQCEIVKPGHAIFTGKLKPKENSHYYTILVDYKYKSIPRVYVIEPAILVNAPHIYPDDRSLCLFYQPDRSYSSRSYIADTIIPWTCEWLYFYEEWLETGVWWGAEAPHTPVSVIENEQYREEEE